MSTKLRATLVASVNAEFVSQQAYPSSFLSLDFESYSARTQFRDACIYMHCAFPRLLLLRRAILLRARNAIHMLDLPGPDGGTAKSTCQPCAAGAPQTGKARRENPSRLSVCLCHAAEPPLHHPQKPQQPQQPQQPLIALSCCNAGGH